MGRWSASSPVSESVPPSSPRRASALCASGRRSRTRRGSGGSSSSLRSIRGVCGLLLWNRPSFSWSDLSVSIDSAIHDCTHDCGSDHCCCVCLLESVQNHRSSNALRANMASIAWRRKKAITPSSLESSLGDFASIGGNATLKKCLYDYIINPCLHSEVHLS